MCLEPARTQPIEKPVDYRLQSAVAAWLDFDADGFAVLSCQISGGRSRWAKLREGLTAVTSVIPVKSTRPAVENVCIVATDDALELVETDLDVAVRYRIDDVKVEEPGTALVPARVAADFVRDLLGELVA